MDRRRRPRPAWTPRALEPAHWTRHYPTADDIEPEFDFEAFGRGLLPLPMIATYTAGRRLDAVAGEIDRPHPERGPGWSVQTWAAPEDDKP